MLKFLQKSIFLPLEVDNILKKYVDDKPEFDNQLFRLNEEDYKFVYDYLSAVYPKYLWDKKYSTNSIIVDGTDYNFKITSYFHIPNIKEFMTYQVEVMDKSVWLLEPNLYSYITINGNEYLLSNDDIDEILSTANENNIDIYNLIPFQNNVK